MTFASDGSVSMKTTVRCDEWLAGYYGKVPFDEYTLLDRAVRTLLGNRLYGSPDKPLPWEPWRGITPSHVGFRGIWNWDSAFHAIGVRHWDPELAREQIRMFLSFQRENGLLPDVMFESGQVVDGFGKPPVMAWAAMMVNRTAPDMAFVEAVYLPLVRNEAFWCRERGGDRDGLFHYDAVQPDPVERLKCAKYETGWDNSVRWDQGLYELCPVDLNCFMVQCYQALAYFAQLLGLPTEQAKWQAKGQALAARIEATLWDESAGAYLDYDFGRKAFVQALTPASFMPLYVGIASKERAAAMASIGGDRKKFSPGWPTVAYDHPQFDPESYWRGRTWLNVAYFALKGLKNYGYDAIAEEGRRTILDWVRSEPAQINENYHSQNGRWLGVPHFSWSAVFVLEFLLCWER